MQHERPRTGKEDGTEAAVTRRRSKFALVITLAAMAAAALVAVAVGTASAAAAATSERIVFQSDRDGNWELYAMNADGSSPTRLTFDPRFDGSPTTPASGARIAFARGGSTDGPARDEEDWPDIYVMDADGSNVERLTRDAVAEGSPSFSPDGSKIAFASYRDQNSSSDIYVMNADGSGRVNLTAGSGDGVDPAWSPDGSKIAFSSDRAAADYPHIYVMNADGSGTASRLTTTPSEAQVGDVSPAWSPDGRRIAFNRWRSLTVPPCSSFWPCQLGGYSSEILVINADGSGETQLTDPPPRGNASPSWSSDGTRIAFARWDPYSDPDPEFNFYSQIYVMNADGSGPRALTRNGVHDFDPAFAPVPTAGPGSGPLTGRTRLRPRRVTIAGRGRCTRLDRRTVRCAVRLQGRVVRPAGSQADCAEGRVTVTVRFGGGRVASGQTPTTPACRYRVRKRFGLRTERSVRRLSVAPRFGGNEFFSPRAGKRRKISVRMAEG